MNASTRDRLYRNWLRDLRDPKLWHVERDVPVFRAHVRRMEAVQYRSGRVDPEYLIAVSDEMLPHIADHTNAAGPQPVTVSHRSSDPDFPEEDQPPLVGWMLNHRAGEFTPDDGRSWVPGVVADVLYRASLYDSVGPAVYPFRSVDYASQHMRLGGLALADGVQMVPYLALGSMPRCQLARSTVSYVR